MATFEYKGRTFYIDGRLKQQLDIKIIPQLQHKDKDVVFVIDGEERSGKSKLADNIGGYVASVLGTPYDINTFCMTPLEFRSKIISAVKNQVMIYDEAHRGMASARAMSEVNNILKDLMMEMGQRNLFVLIVIPTFFLLDKYASIFRTKGLFHVYERKDKRGFWTYYNKPKKLRLYQFGKKDFNYNCMKFPRIRGRFTNQWIVNEEEYRAKKSHSFSDKPEASKSDWSDREIKMLWTLYQTVKNEQGKLSYPCVVRALKLYGVKISSSGLGRLFEGYRKEAKPTQT